MATLYDLAMKYLRQGLPSIDPIFPSTIPPIGSTPTQPTQPTQPVQGIINTNVATGGGDGFSVYNPDPNRTRTIDNYSPYAYNRAMRNTEKFGETVGPNPDLYYAPPMDGIPGMIQGYLKNSILGRGLDSLKDMMPVNPRAKLENELLGSGVMLDDIGRVVTNDYNTAEGIMAGYNAAKVTDATFDKRRATIEKTIAKKRARGEDTSVLENRLDLIDQAQDLFSGARTKTKDILAEEYKKDPKYQFTGPDVQGDLTFPSTYDEDDEDSILEQILDAQKTGKPPIINAFPGYGVPPASGFSVAPGAVIPQVGSSDAAFAFMTPPGTGSGGGGSPAQQIKTRQRQKDLSGGGGKDFGPYQDAAKARRETRSRDLDRGRGGVGRSTGAVSTGAGRNPWGR